MVSKLIQAITAVCLVFLALSTWNVIKLTKSGDKEFALPDFPYPYNVKKDQLSEEIALLEKQLEFMTFTHERARLEEQLLGLLRSKVSLMPYDYKAWHDLYQLLEYLSRDEVSGDEAELFWVHDKYQKLGGWDSRGWLSSLKICASQFQRLPVESKNYCHSQLLAVDSLQERASIIGISKEQGRELKKLLDSYYATSTIN